MCIIILQSSALYFRNEFLFRLSAGVTFLVMLSLFIAGAVMMVVIMLLADLCFDPQGNLSKLFSGSTASTISYYAYCTDKNNNFYNPFQSYINEIFSALDTMQQSYAGRSGISSQCVTQLKSNYTAIYNDTQAINNLISCDFPHRIYSSAVLDGVCTNGFAGIYDIWVIIYILAAFLFAILCLGNLVYAHYGLHLLAIPTKEAVVDEDSFSNVASVDECIQREVSYRTLAICDFDSQMQQNHMEMVVPVQVHEKKSDV